MKNTLLLFNLIFLVSCGTAGLTRTERKQLKENEKLAEIKETQGLLDMGYYFFDAETATGQGGGQVPITGDYYGLQVMGDSVASFLPFFGTTQMMVDIYSQGGIKFQSHLMEKEIERNEKDNSYTLRGIAQKEVVRYRIYLEVFENGSASLNISPTNQSSMSYSGRIKPLVLKRE